jgi:hypothetical protein
MSMIGNYRRVSPNELVELCANPGSITTFLYAADRSKLSRDRRLDVDKTWHAIHFLLNGEPWTGNGVLANAVLGGTELGTEDVGYGPARTLTAEDVRAVAAELDAIPADELLERFDAEAMNDAEIYPQGWSDYDEDREYIKSHYLLLVEFFRRAAEEGDGLVLYLN